MHVDRVLDNQRHGYFRLYHVLGLLGNVFLACIQVSANGSEPSSTRLVVPKLAVLACVLAFLGILLNPVRGRYNFVGICLFVFSDSLKGQLESNRDSLVVVVISAVVCAASPLLAKELDTYVPGLSVLSSALFIGRTAATVRKQERYELDSWKVEEYASGLDRRRRI